MEAGDATRFSGRTAWARSLETPLSSFLRTETGSASILLGAAVAALIWANVNWGSYHDVWGTTLSIRVGDAGISQSLVHWVNSGLMAFFFFVIGLEARREFDLGELRDPGVSDPDRQGGPPNVVVRAPVHVRPDQRGDRRAEEDGRAPRLGAKERAERRLEAPGPSRPPRESSCVAGLHGLILTTGGRSAARAQIRASARRLPRASRPGS